MTEFFRHCSDCGRRFHVKLERKKLVKVERTNLGRTQDVTNMSQGLAFGAAPPRFVLHEGDPVVIDEEVFQYDFKCGHCGHEWTEKRIETHKET